MSDWMYANRQMQGFKVPEPKPMTVSDWLFGVLEKLGVVMAILGFAWMATLTFGLLGHSVAVVMGWII